MAYAMAKVVAFLCMSLLVAHVDSARMLKQVDEGDTMTAQTYSVEETPSPPAVEASEFESIPAPGSADDFDYNKDTATDTFATEQYSLPPPADDTTSAEEFASEDAVVQDQGNDSAVFSDEAPGTLWKPDGSDDSATTESFADRDGGFLVDSQGADDSKPYRFDATSQDADEVYPQPGASDSLADTSAFEFSDLGTQDNTEQEPDFEFDEKKEELGN